ELPPKVFKLPQGIDLTTDAHLRWAEQKWQSINPRVVKPFDDLEQTLPYWMIFTLPRRPALLYLSVWDDFWDYTNREFHQDVLYNFQELIQNFIRTDLLLYRLVRPFRTRTGHSLLQRERPITIPQETYDVLIEYTSPQRFMHNIADFVRDRTLQSGVAYILLVERLASFVSKTRTIDELVIITQRFVEDLDKLKRVDFSRTAPVGEPEKIELTPEIVEFDTIKLQEYDGYVQIQGYSDAEDRNFRIYNCEEEDLLREEIWKVSQGQSKYPLRSLVNSVIVDRYSRPRKRYQLKYGVNLEILAPNWA
ncbi:MAG: hypothetical protein ACXAE3_16215, partial [Candidatus Kariarchaeaceae archaeon]